MLTLAVAALLAAAGPTASTRPAVTGPLQVGGRLTATTGSWAGSGSLAYAYQWYRCDANGARCTSIRGATASTYTLVKRDVGATIGLTVSATDDTGTTPAYASLAGLIAARGGATRQASVQGEPIVGQALRATGPSMWKRCNANGRVCATIAGAKGAMYSPVTADVGHALVAVTAGTWSLATGVVRATPGPVSLGRPSVAGTLQQGKQLRASAGAWSGTGTVGYAYQWYRCDPNGAHCTSIRGSTKSTYTLVGKDVGATIALTVTATDSTGSTAAYAPLVGPVAGASSKLVASAAPAVTGTTTLTAGTGTWTGSPSSFAYAWLRCNANGRVCAAIDGATSSTYSPVDADRGHALVARVTAAAGTARQAVLATALLLP